MSSLERGSEDGSNTDEGAPKRKQNSYLTPLQKSLLHEITTRRDFIKAAKLKADFWLERQNQPEDRSDEEVDAEELEQQIKDRRKELNDLKEIMQVKKSIVEAADSAHIMNKALASTSPSAIINEADIPLSRLPLRNLAAKRDKLALEYLRYDTEIKHVRKLRREVADDIAGTRGQTAALIKDIRARNEKAEREKGSGNNMNAKQNERYRAAEEALQIAKGKREMVKGVLRGLILESGLDWYGSKNLRELMLTLGDDDLEDSEEELDFDSDDESINE